MTDERPRPDSELHPDGTDAPAEPRDAARETATDAAPASEAAAPEVPEVASSAQAADGGQPAAGEEGAGGTEGAAAEATARTEATAATAGEPSDDEGEDRAAGAGAEPAVAAEASAEGAEVTASTEMEPGAASPDAEATAASAAPEAAGEAAAASAAGPAEAAPAASEAATADADAVPPESEPPSEAPTAAAISQETAPLAGEIPEAGGGVVLVSEDAPQDAIAIADEAAAAEAQASGAESAAPAEAATPLVASTPAAAEAPEADTAAAEGEAGRGTAAPTAPAAEGVATEAPPAAAAAAAPATEGATTETAPAAAPAPEEPESPELAALREAREKGTPVEGRVIGWNRGGFHVVVGSVTAFCPSSEMEVGRPKSPASYVEKSFQFKVIKYQKKGRRVVLSRAAVLGEQRQAVLAKLTPGATVQGRVTSLPDFGAFVDLGGVEGLVHVSEISRGRVQHPKDALQLGQEVAVKVLKVDQGGERISLSMKDLEPDPWRAAGERFGRGDRFSGKVLRKTDFGLFVELEPEVEGLLHVSQLPPGKSMDDEAYQPGQPIEGWVREVDAKRQRVSLSLREVPSDDPWKEVARRFPEGESVEGTVESVAPFGVFVTLGPGITGLLPNSQTGLPRGTNAARAFSPGQQVRVQVLSIDPRRKRISLGREGARVEASKNDLQDFRRREKERAKESPTAMAAAFARLRERHKEG